MTLLSPLDDFMQRTIAHVPGIWAKLEYLAGLRMEDGSYEHWGLSRVFGQDPAQRAMEQAHRNLVLQLLRIPLQSLVQEAQRTAASQQMTLAAYIQELSTQGERLLPKKIGGGSAKHFNSVLLALAALAACPPKSTAPTLRVS